MANTNWKKFPKAEPDVILSLLQQSIADKRENKVNMTAGVYKDDNLQPFLLNSVDAALHTLGQEESLWFTKKHDHKGDEAFTDTAIKLLLGNKDPAIAKLFNESKVGSIHCQSGGTGLYIAFELAKKFASTKTVYISEPSWPIHNQMARFHGFTIKTYPYYDPENNNLNFNGMLNELKGMDPDALCLLQPCGQNPTGFDPTKEQWDMIIDVLYEKKVLVLFDTAYYGFATGDLDNDAYPIRALAARGLPFFVTQSFSKNFGLYSGRVGFVVSVCSSQLEKEQHEKHMQLVSSILYSGPSSVGSEIVKNILSSEEKFDLWVKDLKIMSGRILNMRQMLYAEIMKYKPERDWSFLIKQNGMFAYTGLTKEQVHKLIEEYAIYLIYSGRISICGLNADNIPYVAKAFYEVTEVCN